MGSLRRIGHRRSKETMCHILFVLPFAGLVLFWILPFQQALLFYFPIVIVCAALFCLMWKDFQRPAMTGIEGMIGGKAEVIQNGNGTLKIFFRGEIWDAISPKDLSVGQRVEVTRVEKMKVVVRPVR
ncbi:MAG: NfeD family protein [Deltaproteobacteria bacterium]|nr:NfeD family protein [Deltaproteobacteria bacterium]